MFEREKYEKIVRLFPMFSNDEEHKETFKYFLSKSEINDKKALFLLARCYEDGIGTFEDFSKAFKLFLKSAEQGYAKAQFKVGDYYCNGRSIKKNLRKAYSYYIKSAKQDNFDAQKALGDYYSITEGVKENLKKAYDWYKKVFTDYDLKNIDYVPQNRDRELLAEQCLDVASEILSTQSWIKVETGSKRYYKECKMDTSKAIFWYEKAVELKSGEGMFELGNCYFFGKYGLKRDVLKALNLYENALSYKSRSEEFVLLRMSFILIEINRYKKAYDLYIKLLNIVNLDYLEDCESVTYEYKLYLKILELELELKKTGILDKKYILFFDTETTGIPENWNSPVSDTQNWPRLVQIVWQIYDDDGNLKETKDYIIKPDNYSISNEATKAHGITNEKALYDGKNLIKVLNEFEGKLKIANLLVAHNISFDEKIVGAEFIRKLKYNPLTKIKKLCTMKNTTNICRISGQYGYKWPKLQELHYYLFDSNFFGEHNASSHVPATADCYFELKKQKLI